MNIPTCYRCPERNRGDERCAILAAKAKSVKGLGLTSIKFNCEKRPTLFTPGDIVSFELWDGEFDRLVRLTGIVMRTKGRKVMIYSGETERSVLWLYPDGLHKTGRSAPVCVRCGAPQGAEILIKTSGDEKPRAWECSNYDDQGMKSLPCGPFTEGATA